MPRHLLQSILDLIPDRGQPALRQVEQLDGQVGARQERACRALSLQPGALPYPVSTT